MYQLKFVLQQHTPIIHFQHEQEGATLRATEVKPKLDRFVVEKWKDTEKGTKEEIEEKVFLKYGHLTTGMTTQKWEKENEKFGKLDGKGREKHLLGFRWSLDYQLHLEPNWNNAIPIRANPNNAPMYFANIGGGLQKHFKTKKNTSATITSFQRSLLDYIEPCLNQFFFEHNFGTRQSKGYGSFTYTPFAALTAESKYYHFTVEIPEDTRDESTYLLQRMDWFYRALRSGMNLKGYGGTDRFYFKSLMFHYARKNNQQWDKKTIRQHFFIHHPTYKTAASARTDPNGTFQYQNPNRQFLFRDVMGLSSREDWMNYNHAVVEKTGTTMQDRKPVIQRFASPILLKPVKTTVQDGKEKYRIFIIQRDIPHSYLNEFFSITSAGRPSLRLQIWKDFSLKAYLEFCFDEFFKRNNQFSEAAFYDNISQAGEEDCDECSFLKAAFKELSKQTYFLEGMPVDKDIQSVASGNFKTQ